jgi:hypothetical protein
MSNTVPSYSVIAGNVVRFTLNFTDMNLSPSDPTLITCHVGQPGQVSTVLSVYRDGTGTYHADWNTTGVASGFYYCYATGAGSLIAANEVGIRIKAPEIS